MSRTKKRRRRNNKAPKGPVVAPVCPYCGSTSTLQDSAVIYGRSYGPSWICPNYPECDSYVGCHPHTNIPLGRMANKELRRAKNAAHAAFDPLWKRGHMSRGEAYRWISDQMGFQVHVGELDVDQCRQVVALCSERQP